jgi:ribosome biogenesis protein ENP2
MDVIDSYDQVANRSVQVFHVTGEGRKLADVSSDPGVRRKTSRKKLKASEQPLTVLQGGNFPVAATSLCVTPDEQYLVAAGIHKPSVKVFELGQVSCKFETYMSAEVYCIEALSDNWEKVAMLRADQNLHFTCHSGKFAEIRLPFRCRDMAYRWESCDLMLAGAAPLLGRLNLETGEYLAPLTVPDEETSINCVTVGSSLPLIAAGCTNGTVACWDARAPGQPIGGVDLGEDAGEVTQLVMGEDGITLAVGTASGVVNLYDVRSSRPRLVCDQMNGSPIRKLIFHPTADGDSLLLVADRDSMAFWSTTGSVARTRLTVTAPSPLNDVVVAQRGKGLFIAACEQEDLVMMHAPSLGPAPTWCSYLDAYVDEEADRLAEAAARSAAAAGDPVGASDRAAAAADARPVFKDYRFVPRDELASLGLDHLIGTTYLKPALHGYWIATKLYLKARTVAAPSEWAEWRAQRTRNRIEDGRGSRVDGLSRAAEAAGVDPSLVDVTVNTDLVESRAAADDRFAAMFRDPEFAVDPDDDAYRRLASLPDAATVAAVEARADEPLRVAARAAAAARTKGTHVAAVGTLEARFDAEPAGRAGKKGKKGKK